MNIIPFEIIENISKYVIKIEEYNIINKEFYLASKQEHIKRICNYKIPLCIKSKKAIINNNDIYYNSISLAPGVYKILSTISHHHLFIRLDTFQSYMSNGDIEDIIFLYEPAIVFINGLLTPGKISFERFIF